MLVLFTDTDSDITYKEAKENGWGLISMPYSVDGVTTFPYEDYEEFDAPPYYAMLCEGIIPTTSAVPEAKYLDYFEPHFKAGNDILYVHFSAAMSMTFSNMQRAVDTLLQKYPERRFYSIDTKAVTVLSRLIFLEIADLHKAGKSAEELLAFAKEQVDHYALYFFADDLKFFRRSGRVSGLAATMGTLLGIRPIIYIGTDGKMVSIGKEKGRAKAIERLISYVKEKGMDLKSHRMIIGHTDSGAIVEQLAEALRSAFGEDLMLETVLVNPTAAAHCGPNGVGIAFYAKER